MLRKVYLCIFLVTIIVALTILLTGCNSSQRDSNTITIFHAGSLSYPLREIIAAFRLEHPEIKVLTESSGSLAAARKITDLNRRADVFASADYKVIEELLYPAHASWYIAFARNEMAVVFTAKSRYSEKINQQNWTETVMQDDVRFGRSDPDSDPCGYRTLLMWQLAELYYCKPGLYNQLLNKDTRFIRPKEVDLLALLETNTVDYIFLYRSVAEQHGLRYIILPDSIHLGDPRLAGYYSKVSVNVRGTVPGEFFTFRGEPMVYAVTIPDHAPHPELAKIFVNFLIHPDKGLKIMEKNGQPAISPLILNGEENIPEGVVVP